MKNFYLKGSWKLLVSITTITLFIITMPVINYGQAIVTYATANATGDGPLAGSPVANVNTTLTSTTLIRGNGATTLGTPCTTGMSNSGTTFTGAFNFNTSAYVTFSVVPDPGFQLNVTSFNAGVRSSTTGPLSGAVYYSLDNGVTWVSNIFTPPGNGSATSCQTVSNGVANWAVSFIANNSTYGVIVRIYGSGATSAAGNFQLFDVQLNGTVTGCSPLATVPVVTLTQPDVCTSTGSITVTSPAATGMTYSINGTTYTNTNGIFSGLAVGTYSVTAQSACGSVSPVTSAIISAAPAATTLTQTGFTSVLSPKYMGSGNSTRLPLFFRAAVTGLCANTSYRYYCQGAVSTDLGGTNPGAGDPILINSTGTTFTFTKSPDVVTPGINCETFTTDASGNYTGWFGFAITSNTRFTAGNLVYPTIVIANTSGTVLATRALNTTISVLQFSASAGANNGSGIWGTSFEKDKNFALLYDNTAGSGSPLAITTVENTGVNFAGSGAIVPFYSANVLSRSSLWGTIIPNTLPAGMQRIEFRRYDGNITYAVTDNNGKWANDATSTINPAIGSTGINITAATKVFQEGFIVYNGESSNSTTSLNFPSASALTITTGGVLTINAGAKLALGIGAADLLTLQGTSTISGTGVLVGSANSSITITGSASAGTFYFDQSTPNTSNNINTFTLNRSGANATLGSDLVISNSLALTAGALSIASNTLTVNGTITASPTGGTFTGSSASNLILGGTAGGNIGTLYFTTGSANQLLNNFTLDRSGVSSSATMGTALQINGVCALPLGQLLINGNTLTLNGSYTSGAGNAGSLTGSPTSNLIVASSATSVPLTFTYDASKINNALNTLTVNATASLANATTSSHLYITGGTAAPGSVTIGAGAVFATNDSLTLESGATGTARVAANTSGSTYITGNVSVERFIQARRSWRLLTSPTDPAQTSQTIKNSWQEGVSNTSVSGAGQFDPSPGYGTEITNTVLTSPAATGYDQAVTNNPSILYLSGTSWLVPANTNATNINSQQGFMLFLRGDRSVVVTTPPFNASTTTTLRTKGTLNQGTENFTPPAKGFRVLGNPYASEISLDNLFLNYKPTMGGSYYAYDPALTGTLGVGAFVTVVYNSAGSYSSTSTPPASPFILGKAESGEAIVFNCQATSPAAQIVETDKSNSSVLVFRPTNNDATIASFRGDLYGINNDGSADLDDGTLTLYNDQYSDSVSFLEDAKKLNNPGENISLQRNSYSLAIEKRQPIEIADTIFFSITGMKQQTYQFQFAPANIYRANLVGILQDKYLNTSTPVSLTDTTKINFNVTSDPASQGADRFRIVFETVDAGPLPVTFTTIKASQQKENILVQWKVSNELNIKDYVVERSGDGINFKQVAIVNATGNSEYNWTDINATVGENYYRIRSVGNNGALAYSQITNVNINSASPEISVYPDPVKDGTIGLQFTNLPAGIYSVRLLNNAGQQIINTTIYHQGGSNRQQLKIASTLAKGLYQLEVANQKNKNNKTVIAVVCE